MPRPPFRARVETLEARDVPAAFAGLNPLALASASVSSVVPLHARGKGAQVSQTTIAGGSYETVTQFQGTAPGLGPFRAEVVLDFAADQFHVLSGRAVLVDQAGDAVLASVAGSFQVPRHGVTHMHGFLRFTIVAGTGGFEGATGRGTIQISQNVANGNLKFALDGFAQR